MSLFRDRRFFTACVLALLCASAIAVGARQEAGPEITVVLQTADYRPKWQPVYKGVDIASARLAGDEPVAIVAARIDLRAKGLSFFATPSNGDKPRETDSRTATQFLKEFKCQLAINATPFDPVDEVEGGPRDILGVSVSDGDVYSPSFKDHAAVLITRDNKVTLAEPPLDLKDVYNAVGGYYMLLRDGENVATGKDRHPRTAVGLSKDRRHLYFLVIDGRQPGYSVGATTQETAEWMRRLGAFTAVNLDGGGSAEMVCEAGDGAATILNRPIHAAIPGRERLSGNHLGVRARPLKR